MGRATQGTNKDSASILHIGTGKCLFFCSVDFFVTAEASSCYQSESCLWVFLHQKRTRFPEGDNILYRLRNATKNPLMTAAWLSRHNPEHWSPNSSGAVETSPPSTKQVTIMHVYVCVCLNTVDSVCVCVCVYIWSVFKQTQNNTHKIHPQCRKSSVQPSSSLVSSLSSASVAGSLAPWDRRRGLNHHT